MSGDNSDSQSEITSYVRVGPAHKELLAELEGVPPAHRAARFRALAQIGALVARGDLGRLLAAALGENSGDGGSGDGSGGAGADTDDASPEKERDRAASLIQGLGDDLV